VHTQGVHQAVYCVPLGLHLAIDHFVQAFAVEPSRFGNLRNPVPPENSIALNLLTISAIG